MKNLLRFGGVALASALVSTAVATGITLVSAHGGDTTKVHGCVNFYGAATGFAGAVRIVSPTQQCTQTETAIDWNAQGVKGDKGDKGDTGAQGAPGAKGDKGDTGAQGAAGASSGGYWVRGSFGSAVAMGSHVVSVTAVSNRAVVTFDRNMLNCGAVAGSRQVETDGAGFFSRLARRA